MIAEGGTVAFLHRPECFSLLIEAYRPAPTACDAYIGDPTHGTIATDEMLSACFVGRIRGRIDCKLPAAT